MFYLVQKQQNVIFWVSSNNFGCRQCGSIRISNPKKLLFILELKINKLNYYNLVLVADF